MKAEISNHGFRSEKRYSGVYQQQGRMLTDRDWNDFAEIVKQRLDTALDRAIGSGAPRGGGILDGFTEADEPYTAGLRKDGGWVVVDGIVARLLPADEAKDFGYGNQADFPNSLKVSKTPCVLYVDVWERTVVSLEDPELLDVALHGADTTFRCRTMAQLKCAKSQNDLKEDRNPPIGTALFDLTARGANVTPDKCDPCAKDIKLDETIGNYLFRLEVHDVTYNANRDPTAIVLKWSSENASAQYALDAVPVDFSIGGYVYEYYDDATEKHLGVHLVPTAAVPPRGVLKEVFSATPPKPAHKYVRRWDGSCVLRKKGGGWTLVKGGMDRSERLSETSDAEDHGHVALDSAGVKINLNALTLDLTLGKKRFVAGDYWLALARERAGENDKIKVLREEPIGVRHHYVKLGEMNAEGRIGGLTDEDRRRFTFPPLTDIRANDVGYDTDCPSGLFDDTHNTVKKALDRICTIGAKHVSYDPRYCDYAKDENAFNVQKALDAFCKRLQAPYLALRHAGGDGQEGARGETLPCPLIVGVEDENGQPRSGVKVRFTAAHADDKLTEAGNPSNFGRSISFAAKEEGRAAVLWTLGKKSGCHEVIAELSNPPQKEALKVGFEAIVRDWPTVTGVNWTNNGTKALDDFNKDGLIVDFSEEMSKATARPDTFVVALDVPVTTSSSSFSGYFPMIVAGQLSHLEHEVDPNVPGDRPYSWWKFMPSGITEEWLIRWIDAAKDLHPAHPGIRCRVTLKGNAILDQAGKRPLDGDSVVALKLDPTTGLPDKDNPQTDHLELPSGDGIKGGDFESWFYLTQGQAPAGPKFCFAAVTDMAFFKPLSAGRRNLFRDGLSLAIDRPRVKTRLPRGAVIDTEQAHDPAKARQNFNRADLSQSVIAVATTRTLKAAADEIASMLKAASGGRLTIRSTVVTGGVEGFAERLRGRANTDMVLADDAMLAKLKAREALSRRLRDLFCI